MVPSAPTTPFEREILEQPAALRRCWAFYRAHWTRFERLREGWQEGKFRRVVFAGMGSSLFAAHIPWVLLNRAGIPTWMVDAGELVRGSISPQVIRRALVVLVSQSGESGEIVQFLSAAPEAAELVGVTNTEGSTLWRASHVRLPLHAGPETSVTSKTYACTILVLYLLARALSPTKASTGPSLEILDPPVEAVIDRVDRVLNAPLETTAGTPLLDLFPGTSPFLQFVGHGTTMATARQAALNASEVVKIPSQALSVGQFRHGPIEMVGPYFRALFVSNAAAGAQACARVARRVVHDWQGAAAIHLTNQAVFDAPAPHESHGYYLTGIADEGTSPLVEIVPIQRLLVAMARQRGLEPGKFRYSSKVTRE